MTEPVSIGTARAAKAIEYGTAFLATIHATSILNISAINDRLAIGPISPRVYLQHKLPRAASLGMVAYVFHKISSYWYSDINSK